MDIRGGEFKKVTHCLGCSYTISKTVEELNSIEQRQATVF